MSSSPSTWARAQFCGIARSMLRAPILRCTTSGGPWRSRRATSTYPSGAGPGTAGSTRGGSWPRRSTARERCITYSTSRDRSGGGASGGTPRPGRRRCRHGGRPRRDREQRLDDDLRLRGERDPPVILVERSGLLGSEQLAGLNQGDVDIGSVGPTILGNNRIFQAGKAGVGYLLAANHLGGSAARSSLRTSAPAEASSVGPAYAAPYIYVPCNNGLAACWWPRRQQFQRRVAWAERQRQAADRISRGPRVEPLPHRAPSVQPHGPARPAVYEAAVSGVAPFSTPSSGAGQVFVAANGGVRSFVLTPAVSAPPGWWRVRAMPPRRWRGPRPPIPVGESPATSSLRRPVVITATVGAGVTKAVVHGLTNGTSYTFVVAA